MLKNSIDTENSSLKWIWPLAFFTFNFVVKALYITTGEIALDEPATLFYGQKSIPSIIEFLYGDNHPPLYYFLIHYWINIFGIGALSARFISLFFSSLSVIIIYLTGKKYFNFRTGIIASLIYSASNFHVFYAHDARVYPLYFFLSCLSFFFFLGFVEGNKKNSIVWMTIVNILLCYSHFFGIIVVLMEGLCVLAFKQYRKHFKNYMLSGVILLLSYLVYLPVLIHRFKVSSGGTWVENILWSDLYTMLWRFSNVPVITVAFIALLVVGTFVVLKDNKQFSLIRVFFLFLYIPLFSLFFLSFKLPLFLDRYIIFISFFYYLTIAILIDRFSSQNKLGWALALAIPFAMLFTLNPNTNKKSDVKGIVKFINEHKEDGTVVIITPEWFDLNYVYYANPSWFSQSNALRDTLLKNNTFPVNSIQQLPIDRINKATSVIYIDAGHEYTDPSNSIYHSLAKQFSNKETRVSFEKVVVYELK